MGTFTADLISEYLYGYNKMRLATSEEVQTEIIKNGGSMVEQAPLSPRKIRVPDDISLCRSSIPGNTFGACAIKRILHGTWFGPFEGKLVRTTELKSGLNTEFMWEIFHDGDVSHFLDGQNQNNWMSYVRCARHKKEQNLVVFQYHGCIYYRTTKDVQPGNELLVWYDNKYTQLLGLPLAWNDSRSTGGKRRNSHTEEPVRKKREKVSPVPLLQKAEKKISPLGKKKTEIPVIPAPKIIRSPVVDIPSLTIRCDKCFFTFVSKEKLQKHSCIASSWIPGLRPPSLDQARDNLYNRPMHINMPYTDAPFYQSHYHHNLPNYHYPSPPMDPLRNLPTAAHKGAPIAIKNY